MATAFDRLMLIDPPALTGRLLLLHGPLGPGKTTPLRALAHAWRAWCGVDYVLDPEPLFDLPGYPMTLALAKTTTRRSVGGCSWSRTAMN